jgi:formate hydrogenlyase subunit 6/NADH:ubiquinone oxidoreductase subunit I
MKIFTMTKTVTRNLAEGPATLMYPRVVREYPLFSRGMIEMDVDTCIFCGMCARRCPTHAIGVVKESREWQIDRLKCCICNLCVEICPVKCLSTDNHHAPPVLAKESALHREAQVLPSPAPEEGQK